MNTFPGLVHTARHITKVDCTRSRCANPQGKHSQETASDKLEEGGDDVKSSWPLCPGLHTCYNGANSGKQYRKVEQILKSRLSSDRGLQLAPVKVESLVIADQQLQR